MRSLDELVNTEEPGMALVREWVASQYWFLDLDVVARTHSSATTRSPGSRIRGTRSPASSR